MQDCDTSHVSPASRLSVLVIPFKPESHSRGMRMPRRSCARRWRALTARIRVKILRDRRLEFPHFCKLRERMDYPRIEGKKPAARYTWAAGQPRRLSPHGPSSDGKERVRSFCVPVSLPGSRTAGRITSLGGCYEGSLRNSATERDGNRAHPEGNCCSQIRRPPARRRWRAKARERVSFVLAQRLLTDEHGERPL